MAARFWRWILGLALALAVASGAFASRALSLPPLTVPAIALGVLLAIPVAFVTLSFLIAQMVADDVEAPGRARNVARALLSEICEFIVAVLAMSTAHPRRPAHPLPAAGGVRPVLLLHGILCNGRVWRALQSRLHAVGFGPVEALDVEPLLADLEIQTRRVALQLLALQNRCHGERVVIVAHSMGGLIARLLLRDLGAAVIRRIVTIASPHHGTALVRGLTWPNTRQMSRGSPWLHALNAAQEGRFSVPIASIYTREDNLVAPADSARLQGAELHELRGVGHLGILRSRRALERVITTLSQDHP
jgi:pimeloyl-ACP methyl ester carboxylesterase